MTGRLPSRRQCPSSSTSTAAAALPMDVLVDYGVSADVSLTQGEWGTKVGYHLPLPRATRRTTPAGHAYRYNLVVFTRSGETERWRAGGRSPARASSRTDTWTA